MHCGFGESGRKVFAALTLTLSHFVGRSQPLHTSLEAVALLRDMAWAILHRAWDAATGMVAFFLLGVFVRGDIMASFCKAACQRVRGCYWLGVGGPGHMDS